MLYIIFSIIFLFASGFLFGLALTQELKNSCIFSILVGCFFLVMSVGFLVEGVSQIQDDAISAYNSGNVERIEIRVNGQIVKVHYKILKEDYD